MPRAHALPKLILALAALAVWTPAVVRAETSDIAVVRAAAWSPGDPVREGAGEFEVLLSVARVLRDHSEAAIVGVGDRHGLFSEGAERALRFVALKGVPVVTLAPGGDPVADPEGIFLDGGRLSVSQASAVLQRCLDHFGAPPRAADPAHPTPRELAAVRAHLELYRVAFEHATS